MTAMTSPLATGGGPSAGARQAGQQQQGTSPTMMAGFAQAADQAPAVTTGIATQYWDEAIPIPAGPARLWLFVDNNWTVLQSPSSVVRDLVQRAFLGADSVVRVWYDGQNIVGLVVSGS
jgi:hypothetical protein